MTEVLHEDMENLLDLVRTAYHACLEGEPSESDSELIGMLRQLEKVWKEPHGPFQTQPRRTDA